MHSDKTRAQKIIDLLKDHPVFAWIIAAGIIIIAISAFLGAFSELKNFIISAFRPGVSLIDISVLNEDDYILDDKKSISITPKHKVKGLEIIDSQIKGYEAGIFTDVNKEFLRRLKEYSDYEFRFLSIPPEYSIDLEKFVVDPKVMELRQKLEKYRFPVLDFKIVNRKQSVVFFKRIIIEVLEARVDVIPVFVGKIEKEENSLTFSIYNIGWGTANNVKLKILNDEIANKLGVNKKNLTWAGSIKDGDKILKKALPTKSAGIIVGHELMGEIEYEDIYGNKYKEVVFYIFDIIKCYTLNYHVKIDKKSIDIYSTVAFSPLPVSAVYGISLTPLDEIAVVNISQEIPSEKGDRFALCIATNKSALYKLKISLLYNKRGKIVTEPINLKIVKFRELD